jgi:hypothetical protein
MTGSNDGTLWAVCCYRVNLVEMICDSAKANWFCHFQPKRPVL